MPVTIELADTQTTTARAQQLRHELFCMGRSGEGLEDCQADTPTGVHDIYDLHSWFILGYHNAKPSSFARAVIGPDLPSAGPIEQLNLGLYQYLPSMSDRRNWFEPSRVGVLAELKKTRIGMELTLGMIGRLMQAAIETERFNCLLTMRGDMLGVLRWMPWRLGQAFLYPVASGGPHTLEPIYPAIANLHEVAIVTSRYPEYCQLLFPQGLDWVRHEQIRSMEELSLSIRANQLAFLEQRRRWRHGQRNLPIFKT